ncbi:hypothetical protein [Rhodococcus sp. HNM0569]|uniref:hypothetical protein n=1 Tax=Rhodococcus sp. HNM0569 TaxID=2716340 RepID=UPI001F114C62|nr:hypothetical protein [Rhodococcus sp. HNM0569]
MIISTSATAAVDQFREAPGNIDFQDVIVADRQGFTFREERDENGTFCWLIVPFANGGALNMQVDRSAFTKDRTTPMCEWAVRIGNVLVAEAPR